MKYLLSGVAVVAAFAIAGPVWAQAQAPSGGAPGAPPPAANSAMPPAHHAVHHARVMHAHHMQMSRKAALSGDTTAQLNREELARIQAGAPPSPAPMPMGGPPPGNPSGGNSMGMQGPNAGGPGLTPYSGGAGGGGLGR